MKLLQQYALTFVGVPYLWGGRNPLVGLDCSGLVYWLLRSQDALPPGNHTAQTLFDHFRTHLLNGPTELGDLVFYGSSLEKIDHVALALNEYQHIEAAGGTSSTTSLNEAIRADAWVRVTPIRHENRVAISRPDYPFKDLP